MKKENGRLSAPSKEEAKETLEKIFGKRFGCPVCGEQLVKKDVEFAETVICSQCGNEMDAVEV